MSRWVDLLFWEVNAAPTRLIRLSVSCVGLSVYQCCRNVFHGGLFLTLSVDRNDCRVHSVSVSIHLLSLRRICADQWYPVVIPLNRMYKLCICLENDCRVHNVSVSIHLRSLRRICADQWYPVVIPLKRMYKLCICLEKYFIVPLNRVAPTLCCRWYLGKCLKNGTQKKKYNLFNTTLHYSRSVRKLWA